MRLLEIGGSGVPSLMSSYDYLDYVAVDPLLKYPNWSEDVPGRHVAERIQDCDPRDLGKFDLVYAANVLSNRPSSSEKHRIAEIALRFVADAGQLVIIENIAPKQAELQEIAQELSGVVFHKGQPEFKTIWAQHRTDEPKLFDQVLVKL